MKTLTLSPASVALPASSDDRRGPSYLREMLLVLHRCNPVVSWAGWLNVPLIALALVLMTFDHRMITGLNVWIKPIKFALSGMIYLWTMGWLLADLPALAQRSVRRISWGIALSMTVEIACILLQAARGTTSHYNNASALDGLLFGLMGLFILLNTGLLVWALVLMLRHRPFGSAPYVWGMRLGLLLFLVGSAIGGVMIRHLAHTIGGPDGGPGLPVLGWSTRHGDLRAAHFLGLHALQALPLAGWLLGRYASKWKSNKQIISLLLFTLCYVGAVGLLYWRATQGLPLVALR